MNTGYTTVGHGNMPEWVLIHFWITAWGDEWQAQEDWLAEMERVSLMTMPPGMMN